LRTAEFKASLLCPELSATGSTKIRDFKQHSERKLRQPKKRSPLTRKRRKENLQLLKEALIGILRKQRSIRCHLSLMSKRYLSSQLNMILLFALVMEYGIALLTNKRLNLSAKNERKVPSKASRQQK
jgi:hypothetical protein